MHGFLKVFSFFLALGCAKISYNPQKSKVYTFSADPKYAQLLNKFALNQKLWYSNFDLIQRHPRCIHLSGRQRLYLLSLH
jgi:hypothetical protein